MVGIIPTVTAKTLVSFQQSSHLRDIILNFKTFLSNCFHKLKLLQRMGVQCIIPVLLGHGKYDTRG